MTTTDPISDMLTRIRNAVLVGHEVVRMPSSKMKKALVKILKDEGFIRDYRVDEGISGQGDIQLRLHYGDKGVPAIMGLKRVSKPGLRVYVRKDEIPRYYGGLGVSILSTSKGVMTGKRAWHESTGGELLCCVW